MTGVFLERGLNVTCWSPVSHWESSPGPGKRQNDSSGAKVLNYSSFSMYDYISVSSVQNVTCAKELRIIKCVPRIHFKIVLFALIFGFFTLSL